MNAFNEAIYWTALASIRPAVILYLIPVFGSGSGGNFMRIPFTIAIAMMVHPLFAPIPENMPSLFLIVAKELLLGAAIGFLVHRLFIIIGAAGALIDQQAGYTIGTVFDPNFNQESGPVESIFIRLASLITLAGGSAFVFAHGVLETFRIWPLFSSGIDIDDWPQRLHGFIFSSIISMENSALRIAIPFMGILLFSDICVGILGRYAQQLNPFSVVLAIKAAVLALMLFMAHGMLLDTFYEMSQGLFRLTAW